MCYFINKSTSLLGDTPFILTTILLNGTKGCGSICGVDSSRNILALGDGDESDTITYDGETATMIGLAEVLYE